MRRIVTLFLLWAVAIECSGCYAWRQDPSPIPKLGGAPPTARYRITVAGERRVQLTNVTVRNDSLLGLLHASKTGTVGVGFPVANVTRVERRSLDVAGTAVAASPLGLLFLLLVGCEYQSCSMSMRD